MEQLEYIDNYFQGKLSAGEKAFFEKKITVEPEFAEEVAFYTSTLKAVNEELTLDKKKRFREIYDQGNHQVIPLKRTSVLKLWPAIAVAATIAAMVIGYYFFTKPNPPQQLAQQYIQLNFSELSVQMGSSEDSLQTGLEFFNNGKLTDAFQIFEAMALTGDKQIDAVKYAGIVSLQLKNYDKAITYFTRLENYKELYSNPGKFYLALTLMQRSQPGDEAKAKELLQQVVNENLEGNKTAKQWLEGW